MYAKVPPFNLFIHTKSFWLMKEISTIRVMVYNTNKYIKELHFEFN